jgi:hypothetical protein
MIRVRFPLAPPLCMKIVGRVNDIADRGYVTLYFDSGEEVNADCPVADLTEASLTTGDEFRVDFSDGMKKIKLVRLPPKPISPERAKEICDKVDAMFR